MINRVPTQRIYAARDMVFTEAAKEQRHMAFAVTDEAADLIFGERMTDCHARVLRHAIRKAYTSATMRRDTRTFRDQNTEQGKTLADWGDTQLTQLLGGLVIQIGTEWYGGIAVGGNEPDRDEALARAALAILNGEQP
jgi:uncharacterized protein GlcG (DUF336 family)